MAGYEEVITMEALLGVYESVTRLPLYRVNTQIVTLACKACSALVVHAAQLHYHLQTLRLFPRGCQSFTLFCAHGIHA